MNKFLKCTATVCLLASFLTACSSDTAETTTPATNTTGDSTSATAEAGNTTGDVADTSTSAPVEADGILTMGGSTSVEEIVSAMIQMYQGEDADLSITYSGSGSSSGIADVTDGKIDVGLASRGLKDSETGIEAHVFAYDGIAVIVNNANPLTDLSSDDLATIFKKEVSNWSELGGNDGTIVVVGRDAASGTRGAFEEILSITDETMYDSELEATGSVISTVASNANAIGYVSLSAVEEQVKSLSIDGVTPEESTIKDETYPIQRPFLMVTREGETDSETLDFVAWATSDAVAELVQSKGGVAP